MADRASHRFPPSNQEFNLTKLVYDAQTRWLKPAEICAFLNRHKELSLCHVTPYKPASGSLFLFDRAKMRYFRKDGHNWRKKRDGKTVREAHEKLKVGNKEAIHCYYAHGEDNQNFQRRSYWLLEGGYEHIVLVHYREVTESNRSEFFMPATGVPVIEGSSVEELSQMHPQNFVYTTAASPSLPSLVSSPSEIVSASLNSHEEADSGGEDLEDFQMTRLEQSQAHQSSLLEQLTLELGLSSTGSAQGNNASLLASGVNNAGCASKPMPDSFCSNFSNATMCGLQQLHHQVQYSNANQESDHQRLSYKRDLENLENMGMNKLLQETDPLDSSSWSSLFESALGVGDKPLSWNELPETALEDHPWALTEQNSSKAGGKEYQSSNYSKLGTLNDETELRELEPWQQDKEAQQQNLQFSYPKQEPILMDDKPFNIGLELQTIDTKLLSPSVSDLMQSIQYDEAKSLEDSWGVKEFEDDSANPLLVNLSKPETYWTEFDQNEVKGPGLSQQLELDAHLEASSAHQQCFKILDFTPEWSYCSNETKVIVTGMFLDTKSSPSVRRWTCMFGEVAVPAEILQSGVLRCKAPIHEPGSVPFYVTCNNKTACSEICEFEFRSKYSADSIESATDIFQQEENLKLQIRFARLLSTSEDALPANCEQEDLDQVEDSRNLMDKVGSLVIDDHVWSEIEDLVKGNSHFFEDAKEKLLQTLLKTTLRQWLFRRSQHPKGMAILDDYGLGVLHMAAALGYEWAIDPILAAGAGINFRDANGWTALHWAAHCGREKVVTSLVAADAAPGAVTDPTRKDPKGQTAADLAAKSDHGGIAGYLAEASLTSHLSSLNLDGRKLDEVFTTVSGDTEVAVESEESSALASFGVTEDQLSLKDTLAAVRNASLAAARIQAAFRAYSFHKRKETIDFNINEFGMLEEEAQAFAAAQTIQRAFRGHREKLNLAATQIQCKYRSWKGRKNFLLLKHHVVNIQAHVRGHQVRKKYKNILWMVGVLDKAILRWRRKGTGLRGFRGEENIQDEDSDDDDFLKDFRRQKEEALEEALNRVKLMLQYPKARNQYRRMLEMYQNQKESLVSENFLFPDDELMRLLEE